MGCISSVHAALPRTARTALHCAGRLGRRQPPRRHRHSRRRSQHAFYAAHATATTFAQPHPRALRSHATRQQSGASCTTPAYWPAIHPTRLPLRLVRAATPMTFICVRNARVVSCWREPGCSPEFCVRASPLARVLVDSNTGRVVSVEEEADALKEGAVAQGSGDNSRVDDQQEYNARGALMVRFVVVYGRVSGSEETRVRQLVVWVCHAWHGCQH